jgi:hypothetical protein
MKSNPIFLIVVTACFFMLLASCSLSGGGGGGGGGATYSVTVDGVPVPVQRISKFDEPVNYVNFSFAGACEIAVTLSQSFSAYELSPESKGITPARDGNTLTFTAVEPSYLVLLVAGNEPLFILIDPAEVDPPLPDDPDVKNIMDYGVDNTGAAVETDTIQTAIDDASGAVQNILYFPPGTYLSGELWLKSDMTLYLAEGAVLQGTSNVSDYFTANNDGSEIEGCLHAFIRMYAISNAHIKGRGVIDANGKAIRAQGNSKLNLLKIEESDNCDIEGILAIDSSFWNTIIYRSDAVSISNFKVINNRLSSGWNETDGVDFDNATNGTLYNAFLYTGDDSMAVKSDDIPDDYIPPPIPDYPADPTTGAYISTFNIVHEKVVCYSNSAACKIGTKTMGQTMSQITFRDIDVVKCGRGLVIDNMDTATVSDITFEDARFEYHGAFTAVYFIIQKGTDWRVSEGTGLIEDIQVTNAMYNDFPFAPEMLMWGRYDTDTETEYAINNVTFTDLYVNGAKVISEDDPNVNFRIVRAYNISFF